ncbi:MAG: cellulase family glycosylhydrolase [Lachnospiraceae bacterium]|nr:cellulase family glycosylhydrolase [Lachnospiraceae bacterium]
MKKISMAFAAIFLLVTLAACSDSADSEYESLKSDTSDTYEEYTEKDEERISRRVEVNDMKFTVNGKELWINGANTPWQNWNDFVGNMDEAFWDNELARLAEDGINCTRIWISCNGEGVVKLNDSGGILSINEGHWSDLDKLFTLAEKHNVYLMPTLLSFDHFKEPKNSALRWRALIGSTETADAYAEKYVKEFCKRYGNRDCIFAIDIMNEPDWVYENEECGQIEWEHLSYFFGKCAQTIHENSDILVTVGMGIIKYNSDKFEGNKVSDEYLYELTGSDKAYLDFYSTHYYNWQKPWFGFPCDKSPEAFGLDGTKPCLIGETHNDDEAEIGMSLSEKYRSVYDNGWCGIMVWMQTNGEEDVWYEYGLTEKAANYMAEYIPDKIYPLG